MPRPQAPERWKATFPSSPEVAQALLELSAPIKSAGGNESHLGKTGILGQPGGPTGTAMVVFPWERPGVWHLSALATLPPTGLFLAPMPVFVSSWRVCEVLRASHNSDHDRNSAFAAQDTECPLPPCMHSCVQSHCRACHMGVLLQARPVFLMWRLRKKSYEIYNG